MKEAKGIESGLNKLFTQTFPYQLPTWFSKIIAEWTWLIVPAIIIVQPWIGWGYWDDVHAHTSTPNGFFYLAFFISALAVLLQLLALQDLKKLKRNGWQLLYYSAFCGVGYGVVRLFADEPSIGPLIGMVLLAAIFFYFLFQIRPWFKNSTH